MCPKNPCKNQGICLKYTGPQGEVNILINRLKRNIDVNAKQVILEIYVNLNQNALTVREFVLKMRNALNARLDGAEIIVLSQHAKV